jgi:hypothetical protein
MLPAEWPVFFEEDEMREDRMRYIPYVPRKVPADGRVIVHNHVRPSVRDLVDFPKEHYGRDMIGLGHSPSPGWSGFRVWIQNKSRALRRCDCGWSGLPHYCVRLACGDKSRRGEMYRRRPRSEWSD